MIYKPTKSHATQESIGDVPPDAPESRYRAQLFLVSVTCVHTNQKIAEILTEGSFTRDEWNGLTSLFGVVLNLSPAAHFQSLPHWFRLLTRWQMEAVSHLEGAKSNSVSTRKESFRNGPAVRNHQIKKRRNPTIKARRTQARHWVTARSRASISVNMERVLLDDRKRAAESIVSIRTQRVLQSQCPSTG